MQSSLSSTDDKSGMSNENIFQAILGPRDFEQISQIVYRYSGIRLNPGKEELVRSTAAVLISMVLLGAFLISVDWVVISALRMLGVLPKS